MSIKPIYQFLGLALIMLPILVLLVYWERLPNRLPLHFDQFGHADQFGTRREWITSIAWPNMFLSLIRLIFLSLISRQPGIGRSQLIKLYYWPFWSCCLCGGRIAGRWVLWRICSSMFLWLATRFICVDNFMKFRKHTVLTIHHHD